MSQEEGKRLREEGDETLASVSTRLNRFSDSIGQSIVAATNVNLSSFDQGLDDYVAIVEADRGGLPGARKLRQVYEALMEDLAPEFRTII